jgi:chromosome partitioning protein
MGHVGRIICISNQKGGVGKTTTAINLAASLASAERRTLLVDMDPQGNAGSGLGIKRDNIQGTVYDALLNERPIKELLHPTELRYLQVVPATPDLTGAEVELVSQERREFRLRDALRPLAAEYDYVIIDCPPSLGLLTLNALAAADSVLIPLQCEYYALEGLSRLMETVAAVRARLNPGLRVAGMLLTMHDSRTRVSGDVVAEVRRHFPELAFRTVVPRNVRLAEAPSYGEPVIRYDPHCAGADAYFEAAKEVAERG